MASARECETLHVLLTTFWQFNDPVLSKCGMGQCTRRDFEAGREMVAKYLVQGVPTVDVNGPIITHHVPVSNTGSPVLSERRLCHLFGTCTSYLPLRVYGNMV